MLFRNLEDLGKFLNEQKVVLLLEKDGKKTEVSFDYKGKLTGLKELGYNVTLLNNGLRLVGESFRGNFIRKNRKPDGLINFITFEEVTDTGFEYTTKPFEFREENNGVVEQYFRLIDEAGTKYILSIDFISGGTVIRRLHSEKEEDCYIIFVGKVTNISHLLDVFNLCVIKYKSLPFINQDITQV